MSNHALPTLGVGEARKSFRLPPRKGNPMVCKCANPSCLVELHYLRGAKVYLFEIDTVTGAKRPEPRDLNSKAKAHSAEAVG